MQQAKQSNNLKEFYAEVRDRTEELCSPLKTEDYVPQLVEFASPPKWHLAHTTWFFEQMILQKYLANYKVYDEGFAYLFNSYYNFVGKRILRANRGNLTRPTVEEVYAFRKHVDAHMAKLLENEELGEEVKDLTVLGLNHEQQHQELLLTDLKYSFGHHPDFPVYNESFSEAEYENPGANHFIKINEGVYEIGHAGEGFSYDNEHQRHKVYLHGFEISDRLVTNEEYIEFIEAGGYEQFQYWLDDGWTWVQSDKINSPLYWHKVDGVWHHYDLDGFKPVNLNAPVKHVSFYEANAFAAWKGKRLPTEAEWEVASDKFDWGERWEWTNSAYLPYPGFEIAEGAVGEYNGKFMVNQMVLRGASVVTSPGHSRNTYRNFFQPKHQWQYTGIRLAK